MFPAATAACTKVSLFPFFVFASETIQTRHHIIRLMLQGQSIKVISLFGLGDCVPALTALDGVLLTLDS